MFVIRIKVIVWSPYANNDKIETCPSTCEVSPESEGYPLEDHLDGEEDCEDHVHDLQDEQQLLVVLKIDVFEAQWEAAKNRIINYFMKL